MNIGYILWQGMRYSGWYGTSNLQWTKSNTQSMVFSWNQRVHANLFRFSLPEMDGPSSHERILRQRTLSTWHTNLKKIDDVTNWSLEIHSFSTATDQITTKTMSGVLSQNYP